ncbi:hypothetical protein IQ07DRAFT_382636 [Pyrenochaeta sp. DS3sAY3a]|nr:hypothetical protein IQ07DRAFT_382636 [Pyrenochaeta sp. DS3sAY3a]
MDPENLVPVICLLFSAIVYLFLIGYLPHWHFVPVAVAMFWCVWNYPMTYWYIYVTVFLACVLSVHVLLSRRRGRG